MSILADRGLVRPLRPVPAVRPVEGGAASDGTVPARREPGRGGPTRRSRRRAERIDATRKDGVPSGSEAESGEVPGSAAGSAEVVDLRDRTGARRGPGADRPGEAARGESVRGDARRGRGAGEPREGARGAAGRRRAWLAAEEAGLGGGERADLQRSAPSDDAGLRSAAAVRSVERAGFQTSARFAAEAEERPTGAVGGRAAVRSGERAGFRASARFGAEAEERAARPVEQAGFRTPSAVGTEARPTRAARGRAAVRSVERAGFQTSAPSAVGTEERAPRGRAAVRSAERAGFQTSVPSAVETEETLPREARRPVRHIPAAVPANPGRTARERRGEPLRPPSRERVVAGRRGGVACRTEARPSVRWPWLFAIAFAACLIVTGLGVFGAGVSSGPVPSRTASVSVQPGDSLGALAARFAPNADQSAVVERIKELNNLDDTALLPGMPLTVPVAWSGAGSGEGTGGASGS